MAIQTLHDTGSTNDIQSKYDGGVYQVATNDCIVGGVGDEFTLVYNASSLTVSFNAGSEAVIGGSFFKILTTESITLTPNSVIYLCANIDLTQPNSNRGRFVERTSSNMQSDNINGSGTSRDLLLYIVNTSATGVTSVEDKRIIKSEAVKEVGFGIDSSRKIADYNAPTNVTWTATENCFVYLYVGNYGSIVIDGVTIASGTNPQPYQIWLPIQKGTIISVSAEQGTNRIWAWGLKDNE